MSTQRTLNDWLLLLALVAMWGSSFMFNSIAVASLPPWTVVAGRVGIAALVLTIIVYAVGKRLPPLGRVWVPYAVIALIGNAIPFYLITWGQLIVESALLRRESRGGHFRSDFPKPKNKWRGRHVEW